MHGSGGLSPTMSVVVPLVAAFIGATAGGLARYVLDRRADRAEFTAAASVMLETLSALSSHLKMFGESIEIQRALVDLRVWTRLDDWTPADLRVLARGFGTYRLGWGDVSDALDSADTYRGALLSLNSEADRRVIVGDDYEPLLENVGYLKDDLDRARHFLLEELERRPMHRRLRSAVGRLLEPAEGRTGS